MELKAECKHLRLKLDRFGTKRTVPGNAVCANCQKQMPYAASAFDKWCRVDANGKIIRDMTLVTYPESPA